MYKLLDVRKFGINKKLFSTVTGKTKKSFLLNKGKDQLSEVNINKVEKGELNKPSHSKKFTKNEEIVLSNKKKVEYVKVNLADENIKVKKTGTSSGYSLPKPKPNEIKKSENSIKENYACVYTKIPLEREFNLFDLRNFVFAYIFVRQRKGHIYLNFADLKLTGDSSEKNQKVENLMKIFDWLDVTVDFNEKFKPSIFESQRVETYDKWLNYLLAQKDAYKCFCKNYVRCEGNCSESRENMEAGNYKQNKEVFYIRFKNQNRSYKYYDYINYEDKEFDSSSLGDFLLYKNFNGQYLDSFKRVVEDDIFATTHVIEEKKNFNPFKNSILTKHLMFGEKKYIELPNITIKHWDKEMYPSLDISYLKSRSFIPEAIMNEALVLGYTKTPAKEFKDLLMKNKDKDVVDWNKVIWEFDISNVYASSSVFDIRHLMYLNKRNLIKKYIKSHESFKHQIFEEFKQTFTAVNKKHENKIASWDYETWRKVIYFISPNIVTYEDFYNYYFLFEPPIVSTITKENRRAIKGFLLDEDYKQHILKEVLKLFAGMQKFDAKSINKEITYFIFKRYQKDRNMNNVNFYPFLKLIITGYADAPNLAEICELIGKSEVVKRVKSANKITKNSAMENTKLLQEKKETSLKLLQTFETKLISNK